MPTPATRTPIRIARGTYSNLNSSIADILDGEVCWATDQDKIYVKDGGALVATMLTSADVGVTIQPYDANTAKLNVGQTFSSAQTFSANITLDNQVGVSFREATANGTDAILLRAPSALAASTTYTLPTADGTSNQFLVTNGAGALSWASVDASSNGYGTRTVSTSDPTGGSDGDIWLKV